MRFLRAIARLHICQFFIETASDTPAPVGCKRV
jgi:hypothetical protein